MRTPTNIPETPMGETKQDSFFESKEKFQQQLQDIFQTILRLTRPDQFDQLCQWMEYNQYLTIEDFYDSSYNDPEKFDTEGPATEYKWKGKMNHLSANVAQKLKCFVRWMTHEDRPYELLEDFLATLRRERYLKFRHMDTQSFSASSPSHHEPYKLKTTSFQVNPSTKHHQSPRLPRTTTRKDLRETHSSLNKKKSVMMMNMPMPKSNFPLIQNQRIILHIQFISHHFTPRCHKSLSSLPTPGKHFLRAPNR